MASDLHSEMIELRDYIQNHISHRLSRLEGKVTLTTPAALANRGATVARVIATAALVIRVVM